jgi:hypothetical protein
MRGSGIAGRCITDVVQHSTSYHQPQDMSQAGSTRTSNRFRRCDFTFPGSFQSVRVINLCARVTQFSRDCQVIQLARKTVFPCHICGTKYKTLKHMSYKHRSCGLWWRYKTTSRSMLNFIMVRLWLHSFHLLVGIGTSTVAATSYCNWRALTECFIINFHYVNIDVLPTILSLALHPSACFGLLVSRGYLITHNDVPQSVGLLWTSDQPVAETST